MTANWLIDGQIFCHEYHIVAKQANHLSTTKMTFVELSATGRDQTSHLPIPVQISDQDIATYVAQVAQVAQRPFISDKKNYTWRC